MKHNQEVGRSATIVTLTLPEPDSESKTGTLLAQRGDLARVHQFTYERIADLTEVVADALTAFTAVEANPPSVISARFSLNFGFFWTLFYTTLRGKAHQNPTEFDQLLHSVRERIEGVFHSLQNTVRNLER